jgi:hypothetical protein
MVDFCSTDRRLLPVCYVPVLADLDRAAASATEAIELGAAALMVASARGGTTARATSASTGVWARPRRPGCRSCSTSGRAADGRGVQGERAATGSRLPRRRRQLHVGVVHGDPVRADADAVHAHLRRCPRPLPALRWGVIELGASWVPGWMRSMDSAAEAFRRNEQRLQALSALPSEIVRRQIRVTPYPHEPAGWVWSTAGRRCRCSRSDYPHVEGAANPLKRFEGSLAGRTERRRRRSTAATSRTSWARARPARR